VTNQVTVSGGSSAIATASDVTKIQSCDLQQAGSFTVADVQLLLNEALGINPPLHDLSSHGMVNVGISR
jgi:hypothetical protein